MNTGGTEIKTTRLRRKTKLQKSDYPKTQIKKYPNPFCPRRCDGLCHNRRAHHNVGTCLWHVSNALIHCCLQRNMPKACPYAMALFEPSADKSQFQGFFAVKRRAVFYPWGNVVSPRKRVAEGLCGWRHGNSFPMSQSAQSHRQMRSIPRCSKAVFYVFVFDSIHDSTTLSKSMPTEFFTETSKTLIFASDITCNQPKQANTLAKHFGLGGDLVAWGKICNFTGD